MVDSALQKLVQKSYHLQPGEIYISTDGTMINTVLGSCVAVCLWDERRKIGGMNHIMLPKTSDGEFGTTRYANVATFVLYDMMIRSHSIRSDLTARVFGGAARLGQGEDGNQLENLGLINVGERNIEITLQVLKKLKLKVVGKDLGGSVGRRIQFDTQTGKIRMNYLRQFSFAAEKHRILGD